MAIVAASDKALIFEVLLSTNIKYFTKMVGGIKSGPKKRSFQSFKDVSLGKNGSTDGDKRLKAIERGKEISNAGEEENRQERKSKKSMKKVVSGMNNALSDQVDGDLDIGDRSFYDDADNDDNDTYTPKRHRSSGNWTTLACGEPANSPSPVLTPSLPQRHPQRLDDANAPRQPSFARKRATPSPLSLAANNWHRQQQKYRRQDPIQAQQQQQQQLERVRAAKFHEASMHDRPSVKPPSMFTRMPVKGADRSMMDVTTDRLMEQYHHHTRIGGAGNVVLGHGTGSGQILGHAHGLGYEVSEKAMETVTATPTADHSGYMDSSTTKNKQSGLFHFGKSFASTFNPVQIWQRVATNWKEAKEEVFQEEREAAQAEMEERRAKAEREYAALKKDNRLASLGTHALPPNVKVYAPGYTSRANFSSIELGIPHESHRSSINSVNRTNRSSASRVADDSVLIPTPYAGMGNTKKDQQPRRAKKSAFHFRTPLNDLKRIQSDVHLRSKKSILESCSPEKHAIPSIESDEGNQIIRKVQSKKDMVKQEKLTKRVSNLESKLAEAKRELKQALAEGEGAGEGPPAIQSVPGLTPSATARTTSASASLLSLGVGSAAHSKETPSPPKKLFVPGALPTLPSERLLFPERRDIFSGGNKNSDDTIEIPSSPEKPLPLPANDSLTTEVGAVGDSDSTASITPQNSAEGIPTYDKQSPDIWTQQKNTPNVLRKQRSRNNMNKKRKAPNHDSLRNEDDQPDTLTELQSASQRASKKKTASLNPCGESSQTGSPRSQQLSKRPSNLAKQSPRKLLKPIPERTSNEVPVSKSPKLHRSTSALFSGKANYNTDENEPWETENPVQPSVNENDPLTTTATVSKLPVVTMAASRSQSIALANVPTKPTAVATPAHPSFIMHSPLLSSPHKRNLSSLSVPGSPIKSSPRKLSKSAPAVPKIPTMLQENGTVGGIGVEEVVVRQSPIKKEQWEWPEDVF